MAETRSQPSAPQRSETKQTKMNAKNAEPAIDAMNLKSDVGGSLRFAVGDRIEGRWEIFRILTPFT